MAAGDELDELEFKNLQGAVSRVEALLAYAAPAARTLYQQFLDNARGRIGFLEKRVKEQKEEKESHQREQAAITVSALAQRETALSQSEKGIFSGFLAKEFFTKQAFKALEQFYAQTWDRLSDGGKGEMSHGIWEGIRRDEYRFTGLPEIVQEKEVKLAYSQLTAPSVSHGALAQIPEADRNEFIEAYRSGDRKKAFHVLDRDSFRQNMALESSNTAEPNKSVDAAAEPVPIADINLDAVKLKGTKLVEADSASSVASIPNASGPRGIGR